MLENQVSGLHKKTVTSTRPGHKQKIYRQDKTRRTRYSSKTQTCEVSNSILFIFKPQLLQEKYQVNIWYVKATSSHISSDQYIDIPIPKPMKSPLPLTLRNIPMQGLTPVAFSSQCIC